MQAGVSRNTVSRVIKKYKELLTIDRKPGLGRKKVFVVNNKADKNKKHFFQKSEYLWKKSGQQNKLLGDFYKKSLKGGWSKDV